jgi:hypothetical protein
MPLATLVGDLLFNGNAVSGTPMARLANGRSYKGTAVSGSPLVTVPSGNVTTLFIATYHALVE